MAGPFGDMLIMLPMIYLMNQIDWTDTQNLFNVRVGYVVVEILAAALWVFIYMQIVGKNDQTKIKVPPSPQFGAPASTTLEEQTIREYDIGQVKKGVQQIVMSLLIVGFIHYKWGIVQPLFLQCFMTPSHMYKNPLFKIFVLGERGDVENRPFKEENPLAALMPQAPAEENSSQQESNNNDEQAESTEQASEDKTDNNNKTTTPKKLKKPKKDD